MKHSPSTYAPDDAKITVQSLEFLHAAAPSAGRTLWEQVMALVGAGQELTVAQVTALRKTASAEHLHAALTLARLQKKATGPRGKFPEWGRGNAIFWTTPEALEQATSSQVARWKAERFALAQPRQIVDLCCGIGGDALALARVAPVVAVDLSPVRTTCLRFNAEMGERLPIDIRTTDVRAQLPKLPADALFHADPARRAAGKRSPAYEDLIPGPEVLGQIISRFSGGAIKLSPAVDFESLPEGHLELFGEHASVVQAVLWVGSLAKFFTPGTRTATTDRGVFEGKPAHAGVAAGALDGPLAGRILCELDGVLTRAGLAQAFAEQFHLRPLTHDGGYALLAEQSPTNLPRLATPFRIQTMVPFSEKRVADALAALPGPAAAPEVKSRGRLAGIDTDHLQRLWSKRANGAATVLLFEYRDDTVAVIASRSV